jgi:small subunit ribosomal protein S17
MAKKEIVGKAVSVYENTVVVEVLRKVSHPLYLKKIKRTTKYYAHDSEGKVKEGDTVKIRQTRPLSKLKRWKVVEILSGGEKND